MKIFKFQKAKIEDIDNIVNLFYLVFNKKISSQFIRNKYFYNNGISFVAKANSMIIGYVGFVKKKPNEKFDYNLVFSRHSSCVIKEYRRLKVYSNLCNFAYQYINKNFKKVFIVSWPNKINIKVPKNKNFVNEIFIGKYLQVDNLNNLDVIRNDSKKLNKFQLSKISFNNNFTSLFLKDIKYIKKKYNNLNKRYYLFNIKIKN